MIELAVLLIVVLGCMQHTRIKKLEASLDAHNALAAEVTKVLMRVVNDVEAQRKAFLLVGDSIQITARALEEITPVVVDLQARMADEHELN